MAKSQRTVGRHAEPKNKGGLPGAKVPRDNRLIGRDKKHTGRQKYDLPTWVTLAR